MADKILEVKGLKQYFPVNDGPFSKKKRFVKAVDNVSFSIEAGKTVI